MSDYDRSSLPVIRTMEQLYVLVKAVGLPVRFSLGPITKMDADENRLYPRLLTPGGNCVGLQCSTLPANACKKMQTGTWWHGLWQEMFDL